ncbi:Cas4: CRISPR-associated protein Cas4 [Desulfobacula toluolica Tol2]|uniref:CRISPR-associated exonuclease Cas4 n=1 Tax=Desulfobacula toluolica (strain DSM 7467 / Tol2) TaxID=651182 RepID=K0NQE1_DESTT|nr:Cas4: CRISPR-associated protein Cas4 [Desulfobacula toluolica Tol2]
MDIPENQGSRFKVAKGREIHKKIRKTNPEYLRTKLGVIKKESDVYLDSDSGICGIVDEILFMADGCAVPLDYKYAEFKDRIFETYHFQLVFYGKLIKENYGVPVNDGYIVYTRSKNKLVRVDLKKKDFEKLNDTIEEIDVIIKNGKYPKPTKYKKRCIDCCYKNICES